MSSSKFSYHARFVGRRSVAGPLNDAGLSKVVADLNKGSGGSGDHGSGGPSSLRCNIEFGEKSLAVTYIRRDEGFESDGESTKSSSTEEVNNANGVSKGNGSAAGIDEKIIKDHVFKMGAGGDSPPMLVKSMDDSSSANSSGSDSDDNRRGRSSAAVGVTDSSSGASSQSASPVADLQKYKFDHRDDFPIGDVLICHTDKAFSRLVVWVVRTKIKPGSSSGGLEALVFECSGEDEVRELCSKFSEVSRRVKLERHRRRKSDGGSSVVTRSMDALFGKSGNGARKGQGGDKVKSVHMPSD